MKLRLSSLDDLTEPEGTFASEDLGVGSLRVDQENFLHGVDFTISRDFGPAIMPFGAGRQYFDD